VSILHQFGSVTTNFRAETEPKSRVKFGQICGKLVALIFVITCQFALAGDFSGMVVSVADGDTITVLDEQQKQHKVRLAGIDAPEKKQAYGTRSKVSLSALVYGRFVTVESAKSDRYGRQVGKVLVSGKDANLEQVQKGMAWHYKAYEREQSPVDREAYSRAEELAKAGRVGLWRDTEPQPPWEFRKAAKVR
jgi:endonuclease YncB( thermonuclease family)